ncbi:putative electron transport complex RsxE subunit [Collinsella intestinalis DSM 13280]|uniref:Putative electron transport complex RsxE subunit n=1 Tax=Collinsella intestinalis DSM 13280 TaxID=521003 RepID=C4FA59_9ACTN|nr:Rnf-Nqr domain containing protein [Collinsella intestinalis]EEP44368.1 putative electron transport complex RsxE subunit [Collinsella intestinalis DSM 13280]
MALNENIVREQDARISKMVHTPTFLVVAGALPGLFAATSLENGLMIGLVTAAAIVVMASIAPLLRAFTGAWSRTAVMLMVSVTVVTLLGFGVRVTDPVVFEALGIYLPLVAVNAIVVAWIAGDGLVVAPAKTPLMTAIFAAAMVLATLVFVGFINGMLTTGQVFGLTMGELAASPIAAFGKPAGSLLVLALVAVFVQSIEQMCAKGADADATSLKGGER